MGSNLAYLFPVLEIVMIDIVLSFDNMGVIAMAVRRLPQRLARLANMIGVIGAVLLRIIFSSVITKILLIEWLPIRLVGGLLLLKVTWNLLNIKEEEYQGREGIKTGFWTAVYNIIMADFSVSLDNALAVGGIARGNISLIVFGLLLNIPLIFLGSQIVVGLIKKYRITIFIGAGLLVNTALEMMLEDRILAVRVSKNLASILPWVAANIIILYGFLKIHIFGNVNDKVKRRFNRHP